ncbi:MAG: 50S ribosomal protein L30 [Bacteroidia bacterium]|jgi:large subunit ribosomal protein L30|nr:MAG: 50S ribosomal protein L30 [Bacteroidia bacterium]
MELMKPAIRVKITQVRSSIDCPRRQRDTLRALGLRRRMHVVEKEVNPAILGMLRVVSHLVKIERVS